MTEVEGMFKNLLGSIQSHFEDRLKSPFAGAFVIAWLAINWVPVLILIASDKSIEDRINTTAVQYFTLEKTLWQPLIYAFIGVIGYYIVATVFVAMFEMYGMLRRYVERRFDGYRWVPPAQYLQLKKESRSQISDLTELATDHLEKIAQLQNEAAKSAIELSTSGQEIKRLLSEQENLSSLVDGTLKESKREKIELERKISQLDKALIENSKKLKDMTGLEASVKTQMAEAQSQLQLAIDGMDGWIVNYAKEEDPASFSGKKTLRELQLELIRPKAVGQNTSKIIERVKRLISFRNAVTASFKFLRDGA